MSLLSQYDFSKLVSNGKPQNTGKDHFPVVRLFLPFANCSWLLTEIDPLNTSIAFGLCDLGQGFPELGYVSMNELWQYREPGFLKVKKDDSFIAGFPLSVYTAASRGERRIVVDPEILKHYCRVFEAA